MSEIRELGADLVAVSPQTHDKSVELVAKHRLDFDMLRDPENQFADRLGLRFELPADLYEVYLGFGIDLESSNGETSRTLAMPARYIVDSGGVIRYAAVHPDYTRRPEPAETVEALRKLAS